MSNEFYEQVNVTGHNNPIFIVTSFCPGAPTSGACEFCPGPCSSVSIAQLDNCMMEDVGLDKARKIYKKVDGPYHRIKFWAALKNMETRLLT